MAKTRAQKAVDIAKITDRFKSMKSATFAQVSGLTMLQADDLRKKAKDAGVEVFIAKKTVLALAAQAAGIENLDPKDLTGSILTATAQDEVSAAKIVHDFAKVKDSSLTIVAGVLEGQGINADEVNKLASLPTKEQLYAQLAATLNAPISGFVQVLAGNLRGLVTVLDKVREQKA
jgi:large subunit ribosomal protein L10